MPDIILYIAASLDGYIARPDGYIGWLNAVEAEGEDYGYSSFYASVDSLVMGSVTYEQVRQFGAWPYEGKRCIVLSKRLAGSDLPGVTVTSKSPADVLADLEAEGHRRTWLVGGAAAVASFRASGLISRYIISVIPTLLGEGIPLFGPSQPGERLKLVNAEAFPSGLVQLTYDAVASHAPQT